MTPKLVYKKQRAYCPYLALALLPAAYDPLNSGPS